jgi:hypothetical protein
MAIGAIGSTYLSYSNAAVAQKVKVDRLGFEAGTDEADQVVADVCVEAGGRIVLVEVVNCPIDIVGGDGGKLDTGGIGTK